MSRTIADIGVYRVVEMVEIFTIGSHIAAE